MSRTPLRIGGTCRRGHVLGPGDIAKTGNSHTCGICLRARRAARFRAHYHRRTPPPPNEKAERNAQAVAYWLSGKTFLEISNELGVSRQRAQQLIARAGGVTVRMLADDLAQVTAPYTSIKDLRNRR